MSYGYQPAKYVDFIVSPDTDIVREVQDYCADLDEAHVECEERLGRVDGVRAWDTADAEHVASLFNQSPKPMSLFRFVDEKPGNSTYVGYRTRDGREWFHILRQMRNTRGSGLLENIRKDNA